jgi:hypothetical protein
MTTSKSYLLYEEGGTSESGRTLIRYVWSSHKVPVFLGTIKWHGPWRQYVFAPADNVLFDKECLHELGHELRRMTDAHKAQPR